MKQILRLGESYSLPLIKRYILYVLLINIGIVCLLSNTAHAQTLIKGTVTDSVSKEPLPGVTITLKGSSHRAATNTKGEYRIFANPGDILVFSAIGYKTLERKTNGSVLNASLETATSELDEVEISTGYQHIPKERATGSFVYLDSALINRSVSTNILDRLKGVASGVLFQNGVSTEGLNIRGRSTIFANTSPLIVVDNFAYDGDLSTINPNDVSSVTILKDAAAASIWGVRASNGVIVITTKKGQLNQPTKVSFNSNVTVREKADLFGRPQVSSSDMVDIDTLLFNHGAFNSRINSKYLPLPPVAEILSNANLSQNEKEEQINALRAIDNRSDQERYYYRPATMQQYALNLSGGGQNNQYYFSVGYDRNLEDLKNQQDSRLSINARNSYYSLNRKLEFNAAIGLTLNNTKSGYTDAAQVYPFRTYIPLADEQGNPVTSYPGYRKAWADTIYGGQLLDWGLRPLEEFNRGGNERKLTNYLLNAGAKYRFKPWLNAEVLYQYSKGVTDIHELHPQESYYTRDLLNSFSQLNAAGTISYPVPKGDILDAGDATYFSHSVRGQLNVDHSWDGKHQLTALAGIEVKHYRYDYMQSRLYGYDESVGASSPVDNVNDYSNPTGGNGTIPYKIGVSNSTDRYVSYFANAAYSYRSRYNLTASARRDASNLFGVKSNDKTVPLWSVGASWQVDKEAFYQLGWLPELRLRITNGYNGNVDKSVSAFTTARSINSQYFLTPAAEIVNPPNPSLRWEKINVTNFAIDFGATDNRISGFIEYYIKSGKDIIGDSPLPPSTGMSNFRGNSANIKGRGLDLTLNSVNLKGTLGWNSQFLFSYNQDEVSKYLVKTSPLGLHEGYPVNGLFAYRWAGLDPETGDPQGYLDGDVSKVWGTIINVDSSSSVAYKGSGDPRIFGSLRNTFQWENLTFSFNLLYKLDYVFLAPSVDYGSILTVGNIYSPAHSDYLLRWQKPGDEAWTQVPSLVYPSNASRNLFYGSSEALVRKGGQIRLQDIQLSYDLNKHSIPHLPFNNIRIYCYASNLGILWKANGKELDPDYLYLPEQKQIALGLNVNF